MVSFRFFGRDSSWTEFRVSRSKLAHTATNGTRSRWVALRWFLWILRDGIFARFSTDSLFFFFGHSDSSSLAYSHSFVVAFFLLEFQFLRRFECTRAYYTCTHPIHSQHSRLLLPTTTTNHDQHELNEWLWDNDLSLICNGTNRTKILLLPFFFCLSSMNARPDIDQHHAITFMSALLLGSCMMSN